MDTLGKRRMGLVCGEMGVAGGGGRGEGWGAGHRQKVHPVSALATETYFGSLGTALSTHWGHVEHVSLPYHTFTWVG